MINGRKILGLLAFVTISGLSVSAQNQDIPPKVKLTNSVRASESQPEELRLLNIVRVKQFAERALDFKALNTKAITVSRLADLLWQDDEPYARQLFSKALDACTVEKSGSTGDGKLSRRGVASIRRQIIGYLSRRDAKWAKQIIDSDLFSEADKYSGSQANIETAYDLAINNDAKSAVDFAERSLKGGVSPWVVGLLVELRRTDPERADSLFLQVLEKLGSDQSIDVNTFLYLGTYLFTSPKVSADDPTANIQVVVGRYLVYDITLDRTKVSPVLVRAYIQTAIGLLTRPNSESQSSLSYVIGYLLLPKARRFAPDLEPMLSSAMQGIASKVPRELLDGAAYKNLDPPVPRTLDETLADIEKLSSESLRNEKYLSLVSSLWEKRQYRSARSVATKLSDLNIRDQLDVLIDFGEAADSLGKGDASAAARIAEKMPRSIERSIIWLSVAYLRLAAKDIPAAASATTSAVETVTPLVDLRRGSLLLEGAGLMASLNAGNAMTLFTEAIKEFNTLTADAFARIEWRQKIKVENTTRVFSLKVRGFDGQVTRAIASLASFDTAALISGLDMLSQEETRGQLMVSVAGALLKAKR